MRLAVLEQKGDVIHAKVLESSQGGALRTTALLAAVNEDFLDAALQGGWRAEIAAEKRTEPAGGGE